MKVEMTVETPFPSGPDPVPEGESSAQRIVKIHASMSGPAEYHLSRAPEIRK